jgi:hypothetical protein
MSQTLSTVIAVRAEETLHQAGITLTSEHRGPVPLQAIFLELGVLHVALPRLTVGTVRQHLTDNGISIGSLENEDQPLAGFLFKGASAGWAFINADDILPRRRFTAAHELGHYVLHADQMPRGYHSDTADSILETLNPDAVHQMEREANQFAVEILMPEAVCRQRAWSLRSEHGICPRSVLIYRLAAELLVSREAMRYRLQALELGDE